MKQRIGHCITPDNVRIAYAISGEGPPVVKAANWLNHLEFDRQSPVFRHYFAELSAQSCLVRYDERGNGLSEREVDDFSLHAFVRDLEAVVDDLELDRFVLLGISQGCAVSIEYATRHPERVRGLIALGGYARGWAKRDSAEVIEQRRAMLTLTRQGWGTREPAFREMWSQIYVPGGNPEHIEWWNELQRVTTTPENAARILESSGEFDVSDRLEQLDVPTLILHARGDRAVPFSQGEELALGIRGARFVPLDSDNHIILEHEAAWKVVQREVVAFLRSDAALSRATAQEEGADESEVPDPFGTGAGLSWFRASYPLESTDPLPLSDQVVDPEQEGLEGEDPLIGTSVAHYKIIERVGVGGMGIVYRATDLRLSRDVALKFLPAHMARQPRALERFVREARAVSALNHPNICVLHEIGEHEGRPYLVLELLEGTPLDVLLKEGRLAPERAIEIASAVAEGLDVAHEAGILHRDIKPGNLYITRRGHVKILDFGIAKLMPQDSSTTEVETLDAAPPLTQTGVAPGTCSYMSPEQIRGHELDERSDLFSLGAVLYEMLSGKMAFDGPTTGAIVEKILKPTIPQLEPASPMTTSSAGRTPRLQQVIDTSLMRDPARRFKSARDMRQALESLRVDLLTDSRERLLPSLPASSSRGRMIGALLAVALLVAVVWIGARGKGGDAAVAPPVQTIAVLPVEDLSPTPVDRYLIRSVPDEVINVLTHSRELAVRPFSETRLVDPTDVDLEALKAELGIDHLVTGQIHLDQGEFHLTLEATELKEGRIVWRDTLTLPERDLLWLRDSISERVQNGLLPLLGVEITEVGTQPQSEDAYRLYLEALTPLNDPGPNREAIAKLEQAAGLDPNYAPLWAELGRRRHVDGFYWGGGDRQLSLAREAIEKALDLDPDLLEAAGALVEIDVSSGRVESAYRVAERMVEQRPNSAYAWAMMSVVLRYGGSLDQAVAACEKGRDSDPHDRQLRACTWAYLWTGDYETAVSYTALASSLLWANDVQARIALMENKESEARSLWSRQAHESAGRLRRDYMVSCLEDDRSPEVAQRFRAEKQDVLGLRDPEWQFFTAGLFAHCGYEEWALELLASAAQGGYCVDPSPARDPLLVALERTPELLNLRTASTTCRERVKSVLDLGSVVGG